MKEKEKGKRKRKSSGWRWKRRRPVVSCSLVFTCNVNSGECIIRRRRRRRRGREELWLTVATTEAGGELRELLSTVLYCALFLLFSFSPPINRVET